MTEGDAIVKWSWSVTYITEGGFEATLTAWGDDAGQVLGAGKCMLARMQQQGITPARSRPVLPEPHRVVGGRR